MIVLDDIDHRIIALLQSDGRLSIGSIANELGMSRTAIHTRVEKLLGSGAIRIIAAVHPHAVGLLTLGHISVRTERSSYAVAKFLASSEQAPFVSVVAGEFGVVAELRCTDIHHLARVVEETQAHPDVRNVQTFVYTEIAKDANFPLGKVTDSNIDAIDAAIIDVLHEDGRTSYAAIAGRVGHSANLVRFRINKLRNAGVLHIGALLDGGVVGYKSMIGLELRFSEGVDSRMAALETLIGMPEVAYVALGLGRCDAIVTIAAASADQGVRALETIRQTHGVSVGSTWMHLDLLKERY
jgi:DNA-binding Lrp family transcriptional regulator